MVNKQMDIYAFTCEADENLKHLRRNSAHLPQWVYQTDSICAVTLSDWSFLVCLHSAVLRDWVETVSSVIMEHRCFYGFLILNQMAWIPINKCNTQRQLSDSCHIQCEIKRHVFQCTLNAEFCFLKSLIEEFYSSILNWFMCTWCILCTA